MVKIGIVGPDTQHAVAWTELLQGDDPQHTHLSGARVTALWSADASDEERGNVAQLRERYGIDVQVDAPEDLIGQVDGVFVLARAGDQHLALARPFLERKVPTYIDKPLANCLAEAKEIVALAEANGTPLTCASGLRYVPEVTNFHTRAEEIGRVRSGTVTGPGELFYYGIHAAELLQAVFGSGIAWVSNAGDEEKDVATIGYADGRTVVLQIIRFGGHGWEFCYYSDRRWDRVPILIPGWSFYRGVLEQAVAVVATGKGGPSHDEMIEVIAVLEAMRRSAATGERIELPPLIEQA